MSKYHFTVALLLAAGMSASAQPAGKPADPGLAAVPTDAFFFVSVKISRLWDNPAAKPLRDWIASQKGGTFEVILGLSPSDVDRLTLFAATGDPDSGGAPVALATTRKPYDKVQVLKSLGVDRPGAGAKAHEISGAFRWVAFVDDRTLLYLPRGLDDRSLGAGLVAQLIAKKPDGALAPILADAHNHDVTLGIDLRGLNPWVREFRLDSNEQFVPYLELLKARTARLTADFQQTARVQFVLDFPNADAARRAAPVLERGMKMIIETLGRDDAEFYDQMEPAIAVLARWGMHAVKNGKLAVDGSAVIAAADVPFAKDVEKLVAALPKKLAGVRNDRLAINNLKQLGLAIHNFESTYGFSPSDIVPGEKPVPHSWRVQILPFLERGQVIAQLDMTKPWDDPKNLKILEEMEMPKIFEFPGRPAPKGRTYFRIFSLPKGAKGTKETDRPWLKEGERGPKILDVTDGTSNTFMVVEAGEAVPWYKPDVLAYDGKLPLPMLGDNEVDRFLVAMADGSVKSLRPSRISEKTLRALITIQGGEVVKVPQ